MRDKVSGAITIPKASWGCAPALPNRIQVVFLGQAAGEQSRAVVEYSIIFRFIMSY